MKKSFIIFLSVALTAGFFSSCKKEIAPLNGPSVDQLTGNPTILELNTAVTGSVSGMRIELDLYLDVTGVLGREFFRFSASEPSFTNELMGKDDLVLNNNVFYLNRPWNSRYRVIRNCNILIEGVTKSSFVSPAQRKGYIGFAKTVMAYQLLLNLNYTYTNGVRVDVADPANRGPFLSYEQSLEAIAKLLDEGKTELEGADLAFDMPISNKGDLSLLQFNRAIAARVAAYRKNWTAVLDALDESFFNIDGSFNDGFYHSYSLGTADLENKMFFPKNQNGEVRVAHPTWGNDLRAYNAADNRLDKISLRTTPASSNGLTGAYDLWLLQSNTDQNPIIRQEELILLYAEAKANLDEYADAIDAIDEIRTAHNGVAYSGAATKDALITEILFQRRFSLAFEGHRWIDMRRYGKLNQLPIDRAGDNIFENLPRPLTEEQ